MTSTLRKGQRVTGAARDKLAKRYAKEYRSNSVRAIAASEGRSYGFVHRLLSEQGVTFRARGGKQPKKR